MTLSRRHFIAAGIGGTALLTTSTSSGNDGNPKTNDVQPAPDSATAPLDFGFIRNPPGKQFSIGTHRLHAQLLGDDEVTVLFEPGLGGYAMEWVPLAEKLSSNVQVCLYDRAGYGWSDPGINPRHIVRLAAEIKQLLSAMSLTGPIILVGHSYGGLIMRQLASILPNKVLGLVLVDSSHEDQFEKLADKSRVAMLPTSNHFVLSAPDLPDGLRPDLKAKIEAFSRMRKSYTAIHNEISSFEASCSYIREHRTLFEFPVTILTRGIDPHDENDKGERHSIWNELQKDMLNLSSNSQQIIAQQSGHHIHIDEPDYIQQAIAELL